MKEKLVIEYIDLVAEYMGFFTSEPIDEARKAYVKSRLDEIRELLDLEPVWKGK